VSHTDPEILALRALGETAGAPDDAGHIETCLTCRTELARLTEVVQLARRDGPLEALAAPPPQLWDRIAAATSASVNGAAPASANGTAPVPARPLAGAPDQAPAPAGVPAGNAEPRTSRPAAADRGLRARWRRRPLATALAGVAAGLIIGVGATAGVVQLTRAPATQVVAQIELSPLPAFPQFQGTTGTAVMRATASQQVMAVTLHAPSRPGFYEVWLLARNGVSMISLGDLNADHTGTFAIPPGTDLDNYSRIDISLQPFNGSTEHSKASVVRGSLPAAALKSA
jgi:Anti-sigma-K factor rskA